MKRHQAAMLLLLHTFKRSGMSLNLFQKCSKTASIRSQKCFVSWAGWTTTDLVKGCLCIEQVTFSWKAFYFFSANSLLYNCFLFFWKTALGHNKPTRAAHLILMLLRTSILQHYRSWEVHTGNILTLCLKTCLIIGESREYSSNWYVKHSGLEAWSRCVINML